MGMQEKERLLWDSHLEEPGMVGRGPDTGKWLGHLKKHVADFKQAPENIIVELERVQA